MGCCWVELPAGSWRLRGGTDLPVLSRCQIEVDVAYDRIIAHQPEGEWLRVAPFRILSFDIECAGRKGWYFFVTCCKILCLDVGLLIAHTGSILNHGKSGCNRTRSEKQSLSRLFDGILKA
jgi:hypothetical protein